MYKAIQQYWIKEFPKTIGNEQCVNSVGNIPMALEQEFPKTIGDKLYENSIQDLPMVFVGGKTLISSGFSIGSVLEKSCR